jgi:flavin reductase (DIM6/NTAB) family NADH-FMN oxidoreductase RutF
MESATTVDMAFRAAMRRFAATVSIITTSDDGKIHGMTATAVTSLSMDPPSLLICINQKASMHDTLLRARRFCVNVLHSDQVDLSAVFSGKLASAERFQHGNWVHHEDGLPSLVDAQANLFCRRTASIPYGTHTILVGVVEEAGVRDAVSPLVYQDGVYCAVAPHALPV